MTCHMTSWKWVQNEIPYMKKDSWKNPAILFTGGRGWENFFPSQILPLPMGRYIMFSDDIFCDTKFYDILCYLFKSSSFM